MSGSILLRVVLAVFASSASSLSTPLAADALPLKISPAKPRLSAVQSTDRIIVRLRDDAPASGTRSSERSAPMSAERSRRLSGAAQMVMAPVRTTGSGAHVMRLPREMAVQEVEALVERLKQDPSVVHAEVDRRRMPLLVPTDARYALQWNLQGAPGGIDAERAWSVTQGSSNTVVAVLDTGVLRAHRELVGARLLPGYDFVSADPGGLFATANDGNGRDLDSNDPGDFVSAAEAGNGAFVECATPMASSWHGTHIAGIIAANGNNDVGVAGIDWNARVLPVRVLGKCGGYASDTADGLRWAAGLSVPGIPINPTPAQVVNLSLGGPGRCGAEEQAAIDAALAAGVRAIVAAAGNDAGSSQDVTPANCRMVIAVTGVDRNGSRAAMYANVGPNVAVAAPGGSFVSALDPSTGVLSLSNTGATIPVADALAYAVGTSEAAAHVSGVVSLMLGVNPNLSPYQVYWSLRQSARAFPNATCTSTICGAGIADASAAVQRAAAPSANPAGGGITFTPAPATPAPVAGTPTPAPATPTPAPSAGTPAPMPLVPVASNGSATPAAANGASATSGSGDGGGGCVMSPSGEPEWLTLALACIALARVGRDRLRRART